MTNIAALGKLRMGIARILHKYPLLGGLVASWEIREDSLIGTMGVGLGADGIILYYSPIFVMKICGEGLIAVLHHEVRHVIYGHVYFDAADYPDFNARTIAEEVTVNENLPEKLPVRGVLLRDYPKLKRNQDTKTRYRILAQKSSNIDPDLQNGQGAKVASVPNGNGKCGEKGHSSGIASIQPLKGEQIGNHERWKEIAANKAFAKATVVVTLDKLGNKGAKPTDYEKTIIKEAFKDQGLQPGCGFSLLGQGKQQTQNWQSILRRYVGSELRKAVSFTRPARRFPDLWGIVPGQQSTGMRPRVMASIDTSGSMTDNELAEISKELSVMSRAFEIHVVECDSTIHRDYKYKGRIKDVLGRGGTSFIPPLERMFLRRIRPDIVIFFTDGFGDAPERQPHLPIIWVLTAGGKCPANWGRVIEMKHPKSGE